MISNQALDQNTIQDIMVICQHFGIDSSMLLNGKGSAFSVLSFLATIVNEKTMLRVKNKEIQIENAKLFEKRINSIDEVVSKASFNSNESPIIKTLKESNHNVD